MTATALVFAGTIIAVGIVAAGAMVALELHRIAAALKKDRRP